MGTTLNGTTPQNTYPSLIKVGDNGPIDGTLKTLSDGLGNDLPMQASSTVVNFTNGLQQGGTAVPTAAEVASKQATLVSGTNIKTINSTSLLGSGDIAISASPAGVAGAIQFSDGSAFASDASNLFWDDANNRLGIGTNVPTFNIESKSVGNQLKASNPNDIYTYLEVSANGGQVNMKFGNGSGTTHFINNYSTGMWASNKFAFGPSFFTPSGQVHVKGSGTTSATTAFLVQNSAGTAIMTSRDDLTTLLGGGLIMPNFVNITSGSNSIGFETSRINFNATAGTFNNQYAFNFNDGGGNNTGTSGTVGRFSISSRFAPTSGTCVYNTALITPIINQTGGANGITRGLYINPTLTAAADFRAIEVTEGNVLIGNAVANTAKLAVKGNGTSGSTTAFRVQNSAGQTAFNIFDNLIVSVQQDLQLGNTTIFWQSGYQIRNKANGLIITGAAGAATGALGLGMSSGTDVNSKAVLELASTTKGFLPPRMTTTQKNAIATPPAGLVVYDTDLNKLCLYTTAWETITSS
jgi:hypothetical protein